MSSLTLPHGYHKPHQIGGRRLLTMSGVIIGGAIPAHDESPRADTAPGLTAWSMEPVAQHRAGCVAANAELFEAHAAPAPSILARGRLFGALVAIAIAIGLASIAYHLRSAPAPQVPAVLIAHAMRHSA